MATEVTREWRRRHRMKWRKVLARYKTRKGCTDCGYNKHWVALDFDHRNPGTKRYDMSYLIQSAPSRAVIAAEIAKCDVRCANCHRIKSYLDKPTPQ